MKLRDALIGMPYGILAFSLAIFASAPVWAIAQWWFTLRGLGAHH